jgi:hypothetical protein
MFLLSVAIVLSRQFRRHWGRHSRARPALVVLEADGIGLDKPARFLNSVKSEPDSCSSMAASSVHVSYNENSLGSWRERRMRGFPRSPARMRASFESGSLPHEAVLALACPHPNEVSDRHETPAGLEMGTTRPTSPAAASHGPRCAPTSHPPIGRFSTTLRAQRHYSRSTPPKSPSASLTACG